MKKDFLYFSVSEAIAFCDYNHQDEEGPIIKSVEMSSEEELQFYSDHLFVYGPDFTAPGMRDQLCDFIKEKTNYSPLNIFQGEEVKSAIIQFPVKNFKGIHHCQICRCCFQ